MNEELFVTGFLAEVNNKVDDNTLSIIQTELQKYVAKQSTTLDKPYSELGQAEDDRVAMLQAYLVAKKIEGRSTNTLKLYFYVVHEALSSINKSVQLITPNDLRLYLVTAKQQRNLKDRTVENRRLILSSFFTWCCDEGYISQNPMSPIQPVKFEEVPRQPLSDVQLELMREACVSIREKAIIEVLYATGARVSELCGLKKADVDLVTRQVKLFGKGKKERFSCLNARACMLLKQYWDSRPDDSEYAFVSTRRPYNSLGRASILNIVRKIGARCGIEHVFPHKLRHTMATDLLNRGMPIHELQLLLGHNSPETTLEYAKVKQENVKFDHSRCII